MGFRNHEVIWKAREFTRRHALSADSDPTRRDRRQAHQGGAIAQLVGWAFQRRSSSRPSRTTLKLAIKVPEGPLRETRWVVAWHLLRQATG